MTAVSHVITERKIDSLHNSVHSWGSLKDFLDNPHIYEGINSVWYNGLPIDMAIQLQKEAPLVVVFHGASTKEVRLPWLSGQTVTAGLPASKLFISDPSLYLSPELRLSWFSGNRYQPDLFEVITQIVSKIAQYSAASHIVALGGSGGGYASLRLIGELGGTGQNLGIVATPDCGKEFSGVVGVSGRGLWVSFSNVFGSP